MANAHLRDIRLMCALIAAGNHRKALEQGRLAAALLTRRPTPPPEQIPLLPSWFLPPAPEPKPKPKAAPDCKSCPKNQPKPEKKHGRWASHPKYDSPKGRVLEACIALTEAETDEDYHAGWSRLGNAVDAWRPVELVGEVERLRALLMQRESA